MPDLSKQEREDLFYTLDSAGWGVFLAEIAELIARMAGPLVDNPDLPEHERRGYVYAIRHIRAGVRRVYEKAERQIPPRVMKELGL